MLRCTASASCRGLTCGSAVRCAAAVAACPRVAFAHRRITVAHARPESSEGHRSCSISGWCDDSDGEEQAVRHHRASAVEHHPTASVELAGEGLEALQDALTTPEPVLDRDADLTMSRLPPVFASLVKRLHATIATHQGGTLPALEELLDTVLHWEEWTLPDAPLRDHKHLREAANVLIQLLGSNSSMDDTEGRAASPHPDTWRAGNVLGVPEDGAAAAAAAVAAAAASAAAARRVLAELADTNPAAAQVAAAAATTPLDSLLLEVVGILHQAPANGQAANATPLAAASRALGAIIAIKTPSVPEVLGRVNMDALVKHVFDYNAGVDMPRALRTLLRSAAGLPAVHHADEDADKDAAVDPSMLALQLGQRLVKGLWGYGRLPVEAVHGRVLPDDPAGKAYVLSKDRTAWSEAADNLAAVWAPQAAALLAGCQAGYVREVLPATAGEYDALPAHLALAVVKGLDAPSQQQQVVSAAARDQLFHAAFDSGALNDVDAAAWAYELLQQLGKPLSPAATCELLSKVGERVGTKAGVPGAWSKLPLGCDPMEFTRNNDNLPTSVRAWFLRQLAQRAAEWGAPVSAAQLLLRVISAADQVLLAEHGRKEWGPQEPVGYHTVKDATDLLQDAASDQVSAAGDPLLPQLYQLLPAAVQLARVHQVAAPGLVNAAVNSWRAAALNGEATADEQQLGGAVRLGPCPTAVVAQLLEDAAAHDAALAESSSLRRAGPYLPDVLEEIFLWLPGPEQRLAIFHQLSPGLSPYLRKEVLRVIRPLLGGHCYELAEPLVLEQVAARAMERAASAAGGSGEGKKAGKEAVAGGRRKRKGSA